MQKILSINEIKVYSRKQVVAWVQSTHSFNFDQLKNGLFFIKILRKLVPHDISKYKICQKPLNQYQQSLNMNIVKKILNKHNLQLNMNVQAVIAAKNCFELANWFKNLYEQNKSDNDTDFHYSQKSQTPSKIADENLNNLSNYRSLSRATSSEKKDKNKIKKLGRMTSGFVGFNNFDSELTYKLFSTNRQKTQQLQKSKSRGRTPRMQQIRNDKSKSKYDLHKQNNWTINSSKNKKETVLTQQQNILNLMKAQALQQQIIIYEKTLKQIQKFVNQNKQNEDLQKIKNKIIRIIYMIPEAPSNEINA